MLDERSNVYNCSGQKLECVNVSDEGKPAGGICRSNGFLAVWQKGPLVKDGERLEPNGCFVETLIQAAKQRLEYFQSSQFACTENALAIVALGNALNYLEMRTARRIDAGTEGTYQGS